MSDANKTFRLPEYDGFTEAIAVLMLDQSGSEVHGLMCGYLCAGADQQGEAYIRALLNHKKDEDSRKAILSMFEVFSISQQQISSFDFAFELLLPDEHQALVDRAKAFGEWCTGFTQGLTLAGVDTDQFYEEEAQEALEHIIEFAELDYDSLEVDEEDERSLMEVTEYTRMAVIRLHGDLVMNERERDGVDKAH